MCDSFLGNFIGETKGKAKVDGESRTAHGLPLQRVTGRQVRPRTLPSYSRQGRPTCPQVLAPHLSRHGPGRSR